MSKVARGKTNFWIIHGILTLIVMLLVSTVWMYLTGYLSRLAILAEDDIHYTLAFFGVIPVIAVFWPILFGIYIDLSVWIKNRLEVRGKIKIDHKYMKKFYTLTVILSAILFILSLKATLEDNSELLRFPYYSNFNKALFIIQKSSLDLRIFFINLYMCFSLLYAESHKKVLIESLENQRGLANPFTGACHTSDHIFSGIVSTCFLIMAWAFIRQYSWL